jgi:SHS2 domain-containing protein
MGFEEIAHTADWALHVWADNLEGLFAEAAHGMNALSGANLVEGPKVKRSFEAESPDAESLLVAFLSELVYYAEKENLAFDHYNVQTACPACASAALAWPPGQAGTGEHGEGFKQLNVRTLKVEMEGGKIVSLNKSIKAVTYHNLQIRQTARGYEVEIVFDV